MHRLSKRNRLLFNFGLSRAFSSQKIPRRSDLSQPISGNCHFFEFPLIAVLLLCYIVYSDNNNIHLQFLFVILFYLISMAELSYEQKRTIYAWIDAIPLSRPKRNICRDFSDGVMIAEVIAAYFPNLVELHNYPPANSTKQKIYNFETLNQRVLKRFGYNIPRHTIEDIVSCKQGVVETVLHTLHYKMGKYRQRKEGGVSSPVSARGPPRQEFVENQSHMMNEQRNDAVDTHLQPQAPLGSHQQTNKHSNGGVRKPATTVDSEILMEKEQQIRQLTSHVDVLELKIAKLEQMIRVKDDKIQKLKEQNK